MDRTEDHEPDLAAIPPSQPTSPDRRPIAPWWHTALMVVLIVGLSFTGAEHMQQVNRPIHLVPNYVLTILYEWVLAGLAVWGIHLRGHSSGLLVGLVRRGWRGWWNDFGAALIFWMVAVVLLAALAQVLVRVSGSHLDPGKIAEVTSKLAPSTGAEIVLFLLLSASAGICEEIVFRGYFQQQFAGAGRAAWVGVVVSAVLFGCAHGYEGITGMLLITAYGAMFSVLALLRGGLRTGMIAHAWHDAFSGIALALLHHYALHSGPR